MHKSKVKGDIGEKFVADYLVKMGMDIVATNYHSRYGEIDIICKDKEFIVFVEVKTRKNKCIVSGLEAVDKKKQSKIIKTAYLYMQDNNTDLQPRFDVAEVRCSDKGCVIGIRYITNAFSEEEYCEFF